MLHGMQTAKPTVPQIALIPVVTRCYGYELLNFAADSPVRRQDWGRENELTAALLARWAESLWSAPPSVRASVRCRTTGMDLRRRRSVLVRMTGDGRKLETARITDSAAALRREIARAGQHPQVVPEATYGWYWAADGPAAAGAEVRLAHPLGVRAFTYRRVKDDEGRRRPG